MSTIGFCCLQMESAVNDPDVPVDYVSKLREYGLRILDGGSSYLVIMFCPWCGHKLPDSLREEWFDNLERLGIDPYGDEIPTDFSDARWYAGQGGA